MCLTIDVLSASTNSNLWTSPIPRNLSAQMYADLYAIGRGALQEIQDIQALHRQSEVAILNAHQAAMNSGAMTDDLRQEMDDLEVRLNMRYQFQELLRSQMITIFRYALMKKMGDIAAGDGPLGASVLWIRLRRDWQALRQWRFEALDGRSVDLTIGFDTSRLSVSNPNLTQSIFKIWANVLDVEAQKLYEQCRALISMRSNPKYLGEVNRRFGTVFARMNAQAMAFEEVSAFPPRPCGVHQPLPGLAPDYSGCMLDEITQSWRDLNECADAVLLSN